MGIADFLFPSRRRVAKALESAPPLPALEPDDDFVTECFVIDWEEQADARNRFDTYPEGKAAVEAFQAERFKECLDQAKALIGSHPDYFLGYLWAGKALSELGRVDEALRHLSAGLSQSLKKGALCAEVAAIYLEQGQLRKTVLWWIRGCHVQIATERYNSTRPFLCLAYLMRGFGDEVARTELKELASRGPQGNIDFDHQGQRDHDDYAKTLMGEGAEDDVRAAVARLLGKPAPAKVPAPLTPEQALDDSAGSWFAGTRGRPRSPRDFDLTAQPRLSAANWAQLIASDPHGLRTTDVDISEVGGPIQTLFGTLQQVHGVSTSDAVELFDTYLGAACPRCFAGVPGGLLQTVSVAQSAAGSMIADPNLRRIVDGTCAHCPSTVYTLVWFGEK